MRAHAEALLPAGMWEKLKRFLDQDPMMALTATPNLLILVGMVLVYGGDASMKAMRHRAGV